MLRRGTLHVRCHIMTITNLGACISVPNPVIPHRCPACLPGCRDLCPPPHVDCIHSFVELIEALLAAGFLPAPAGLELRQRPQLWEVVQDGGAPPALPVPAWALGCLR